MGATGLDHIVLAMADVTVTRSFYQELPGVEAVKHASGTWALRLGNQKVNLQPAGDRQKHPAGHREPLFALGGGRQGAGGVAL